MNKYVIVICLIILFCPTVCAQSYQVYSGNPAMVPLTRQLVSNPYERNYKVNASADYTVKSGANYNTGRGANYDTRTSRTYAVRTAPNYRVNPSPTYRVSSAATYCRGSIR